MYRTTFSATALLALFAGQAIAAPAPAPAPLGPPANAVYMPLNFKGPNGVGYLMSVAPGEPQTNEQPLAISSIRNDGEEYYIYCTAYGAEGSVTKVYGGETVDVGPPQVQTSVICFFDQALMPPGA